MKPLIRSIRRMSRNWILRRKHEGLILDGKVEITNCEFGRFNLICGGTVLSGSSLGDYSYIGVNGRVSRATIGKFCSIGPNVTIAPGIHPTDFISTHPVFYSQSFLCKNRLATQQTFVEHQPVTIGNDVWIGNRVTILDGVTIGTGAIVAAHAVVNKNVEPYSIVGGTPAKMIRHRFSEVEIELLLNSKWWDSSDKSLREHADAFCQPVEENILSLHLSNLRNGI